MGRGEWHGEGRVCGGDHRPPPRTIWHWVVGRPVDSMGVQGSVLGSVPCCHTHFVMGAP
jgi:hypothetical protein